MVRNKTGKYLKYAVGEIILVVIGILIALQINNKNEYREARKEEQILLNQLLSDFNANLVQLDQNITIRNKMMSSSKAILALIDNEDARHIDSLDLHLATTMAFTTYDPIVINLASSGELSLISDKGLKQALNNWNSDISDVIEDEINWKYYRNNNYIPFLIENYQLRTLRHKAFKANTLGIFSLNRENDSRSYVENEIGFSNHNIDMHSLLDNPDFEDHISRCYAINSWTNSEALILRKRLLDIITSIQNNIRT